MTEKTLTDLEAVAIAFILREQPCTAHSIRTCFKQSQTSHFSDSAGSVYPMMRRLADAGIVSVLEKQEGQRMVRYFRCTALGMQAFKTWLTSPFPDLLGFDPLRTQIQYLHRLTKAQQAQWFEEARTALHDKLQVIQSMLKRVDSDSELSVYEELAHENAISQLKARLSWLSRSEKRLLSRTQ